jgi:phage baseplate assembly protein W
MKPVFFGYNLPFISGAGVMPLQADERLVKNDLLILLLTVPGQRVMRPSFGTPINAYPFEMIHPTDLEGLRQSIISAIERNEKRVLLQDVQVQEIEGVSNRVGIKIIAALTARPNKDFEVELQMNLTGGANG